MKLSGSLRHVSWPTMLATGLLSATLVGCDSHDPRFIAPWAPPAAVQGQWTGEARIYNDFVASPRLEVNLHISPDGAVTGRVGDAALVRGRIAANRDALGRTLNLATDYVIVADLNGPLIAAEQVKRDDISMPFDLVNGHLRGGFGTDGQWLAGRDRVVVSASLDLQPAGKSATQP